MKSASTGADGHQYFIPIYNYPWAVFYRKSLFADKGYKIPTTLAT
jgi:multiple sugar transport system substrate-binding protein